MFQYARGPRISGKHTNHALRRIQNKKVDKPPEKYLLSKGHLEDCFQKIRSTAGKTPGPDGVRFDSFSENQWEKNCKFLAQSINNGNYQPGPTKPVILQKDCGGTRTIQIPNLIDRVASRACLEAFSPILEKKFVDWSYGYRPGRSHLHVFAHISKAYEEGCVYLAHFDVRKAFDHVNIRKLSKLIREVDVMDKAKWLGQSIVSKGLLDDGEGDVETGLGISQGDSASGLMFNFYMHEFHDKVLDDCVGEGLQVYRYADDLVVMGKEELAVNQLMEQSVGLLKEVGLECVCEEPVNLQVDSIDILGLTISGHGNNIDFNLTETCWSRLERSLDEGLNQDFPTCLSKQVVKAWRQAVNPVTWTGRNQERLVNLLSSFGVTLHEDEEYEPKQDWYQVRNTLLGS